MNNQLLDYIESIQAVSTHSHYIGNLFFDKFGLHELLEVSYVNWSWLQLPTNRLEQLKYLDFVVARNAFVWLSKSLQAIYQLPPLDSSNWEQYDKLIVEMDNRHNVDLLMKKCNYYKIINDSYWNYGYNHGRGDIFAPAYRINIFLQGYDSTYIDREKNNIKSFIGQCNSIDDYVNQMHQNIVSHIQSGCVTLKCAIAYDRGLDFYRCSRDDAQLALDNGSASSPKEIEDFQSYIMYQICVIAVSLDIPIQIHTGLGQAYKTNAMQLNTIIKDNPMTKFVLFHMSYPHYEDVLQLVHNYSNVYADLCWTPLLSTDWSIRLVNELLDIANSDKISWGCDTWTLEESYGARLAINYVLNTALTKRINNGKITLQRAKVVANNILRSNAIQLYKLGE